MGQEGMKIESYLSVKENVHQLYEGFFEDTLICVSEQGSVFEVQGGKKQVELFKTGKVTASCF